MFLPNRTGLIRSVQAMDVHGRATLGPARECPFSAVNLAVGAQKTSVRADSSASRGGADERAALRAKILVPDYVRPRIGDRVTIDGEMFEVIAVHPRHTTMGDLDHYDCDLEIQAG